MNSSRQDDEMAIARSIFENGRKALIKTNDQTNKGEKNDGSKINEHLKMREN